MTSICGTGIAGALVLGMGGCGLILDVDAGEYRPIDLACQAGQLECMGNTPRTCVDGAWQELSPCGGQTCIDGQCRGDCEAGSKQCMGNSTQQCDASGHWLDAVACVDQTCVGGVCMGECEAGDKSCTGPMPRSCNESGQWVDQALCTGDKEVCLGGECKVPLSCATTAPKCGPNQNENCCSITKVPGGTFNRRNNPEYPATISSFVLDRFEITVGRFRAFVEAYPGSKPAVGAGTHPLIEGSGWDPMWNNQLPSDQQALRAMLKCGAPEYSWTDTVSSNEYLPINCIHWYLAFAFCAWDGGRLPTAAEWNYAAAGGSEHREYPWSNPPNSVALDGSYASYACLGDGSVEFECAFADLLKVGSRSPKGDGKWGQADLGGNLWEWTLDLRSDPLILPCVDCAEISNGSGSERVIKGGAWYYDSSHLHNAQINSSGPGGFGDWVGGRCARLP